MTATIEQQVSAVEKYHDWRRAQEGRNSNDWKRWDGSADQAEVICEEQDKRADQAQRRLGATPDAMYQWCVFHSIPMTA